MPRKLQRFKGQWRRSRSVANKYGGRHSPWYFKSWRRQH